MNGRTPLPTPEVREKTGTKDLTEEEFIKKYKETIRTKGGTMYRNGVYVQQRLPTEREEDWKNASNLERMRGEVAFMQQYRFEHAPLPVKSLEERNAINETSERMRKRAALHHAAYHETPAIKARRLAHEAKDMYRSVQSERSEFAQRRQRISERLRMSKQERLEHTDEASAERRHARWLQTDEGRAYVRAQQRRRDEEERSKQAAAAATKG